MRSEIENFVRYSLRYQILLAKHVSKLCNLKKVYVFDSVHYFENGELKIETIDGIKTVLKDGNRGVINLAIKESMGTNEDLFLEFLDKNVVEKDEIGLYVVESNNNEKINNLDHIPEEEENKVEEDNVSVDKVEEDKVEDHTPVDKVDDKKDHTPVDDKEDHTPVEKDHTPADNKEGKKKVGKNQRKK